jgi:hypothetical protein
MPEVTNPNLVKILNAKAEPVQDTGGEVFIPAPGAAARENRDIRRAELDEVSTATTVETSRRAGRQEVRGAAGELRDAFEKQKPVTDYQTALPAYSTILNLAAGKPNKASDFTIITLFNKVQDPGSAVLGGERDQAADVSTLLEKYKTKLAGLFDPEVGFVSDDARRQFVASTHALMTERRRAYDAMRTRYSDIAQAPEYGVRPELVVGRDYGDAYRQEIQNTWAKVFPQAGNEGPPPLQVAPGKKFSTEQDLANAEALNKLWASGATIEQMNAESIRLTTSPLTPEAMDYLRKNEGNRNAPAVSPASSGNQEAPVGGLMGDIRDTGVGLASGALRGYSANLAEELVNFVDPATAQKLQAALDYGAEKAPIANFIGETTSGIVSPLAKIAPPQVSNPVLREALKGTVYGTLYGSGEADPNAGLSERVVNAAIGAGTGGAGGAIGGRVAQAMGAGAPNAAVQAAQDLNIPVLSSDVAPPTTFMGRSAQQLGERVPFAGTSGVRQAQQTARTDAVTELLADYGVGDPQLAEKVASSLTQTRKAQIDKYTTMKREVIAPLASAGEVPVTGATKAIDDEITRLERISPEGFAPVVSILRRWKSDLAGKSLDDIEVLRRQVGEEFAAPELAKVSGEAQKSLNRIYGPLREDMGAFIKANGAPKDYVKWQVANKRLAEGMEELGKSALKSVLRDADQTPEAVWRLLFSNKPSDVAALYRNLGPQGRAAARSAIMDKVFRDAGGNLAEMTPEKFLRDVKKQASQVRIFFNGDEAKRLEGLIGALKLTTRAGEAPVLTASGQQTYAPIVGAGLLDAFGTGGAAIAGGASLGLLARAYESAPVRQAIMRFQNAKPIDQNAAAQRVVAAMRTAMGQAGPNISGNPEPMQ